LRRPRTVFYPVDHGPIAYFGLSGPRPSLYYSVIIKGLKLALPPIRAFLVVRDGRGDGGHTHRIRFRISGSLDWLYSQQVRIGGWRSLMHQMQPAPYIDLNLSSLLLATLSRSVKTGRSGAFLPRGTQTARFVV